MTAQLSQQDNENRVGRAILRTSPWLTWQLSKLARSARSTSRAFIFLGTTHDGTPSQEE